MQITLNDIINIDYSKVEDYLTGFLESYLKETGAKGYVVGLSGGVDSSTALGLAVKAVGPEKVAALIMPDTTVTPPEDVEDAKRVAEIFGVRTVTVKIDPIVEVYKSALPFFEGTEHDRVPLGNTRARIRMTILYYFANKYNYLVLGTGDRSEILIGYFTKYGDGAVDVLPLAVLYKSQVRRLAVHLGIPEKVAFKPSSPRLWPGHLAEAELGVSYNDVDLVLHAYFDRRIPVEEIPRLTGVSEDKVKAIMSRIRESRHKREPPKAPSIEPILELMGVRRIG